MQRNRTLYLNTQRTNLEVVVPTFIDLHLSHPFNECHIRKGTKGNAHKILYIRLRSGKYSHAVNRLDCYPREPKSTRNALKKNPYVLHPGSPEKSENFLGAHYVKT